MSDLLGSILSSIGGDVLGKMGSQIGAQPNVTQSAVQAALPMLVKALSRNAREPQGREALWNAIDKDHDGSVLEQLPDFLDNFQQGAGAGILKHVLGSKLGNAEQFVSRSSGLSPQGSSDLLKMLAPMVMGALGRQKRSNSMDQNQLADWLNDVNSTNNRTEPKGMGMISKLLDTDGDGDFKDDVAQLGMKMLGGLFRR